MRREFGLLAMLLGRAVAAPGCVYAHNMIYYTAVLLDKDQTSSKVWVNDQMVCDGGFSKLFISENSSFCTRNHDGQAEDYRKYKVGCAPGYVYCMTNNGRTGHLEYYENNVRIWRTELNSADPGDHTTETIEHCNEMTGASCSQDESCIYSSDPQYRCTDKAYKMCKMCDSYICTDDRINAPNPFPFTPEPAPPPKVPIKAMFVGDSLTHGANGDFTWRYRLWEWLGTQNYNPTFVGPWQGTNAQTEPADIIPKPPRTPDEPEPASGGVKDTGGYSPNTVETWSRNHAAAWGRQVAQSKNTIHDWVKEYDPDYLFVMLGFNDIGWYISSPEGTIASMDKFVSEARRAKPNIKFLIANIVHRSYIRADLITDTDEYNRRLPVAISNWHQSNSPVRLVELTQDYNCAPDNCPDGYDGLHPNEMGELKFARAFSHVLVDKFEVGTQALTIPFNSEPFPQRTAYTPRQVSAHSLPNGILVQWEPAEGARWYEVREKPPGGSWGEPIRTRTYAHFRSWVTKGQEWGFEVRTFVHAASSSSWSNSVYAVADPKTPPGPTTIWSFPTANGLEVSADLPPGGPWNVDRYELIIWDLDTPGAWIQSYGSKTGRFTISGKQVNLGHKYQVNVAVWNEFGGGWPKGARSVIAGNVGAPPVPTGLQVTNQSPVAINMAWNKVASATGYRVWIRNHKTGGAFTGDGNTEKTTYGIDYMFPGTWNFEVCVSAYNGMYESAKSTCVKPSVYPGYSA